MNIVFAVRMPNEKIVSRETHLEFVSIERIEIPACALVPEGIKEGILEWMETGMPFFKTFREG